MATKIKCTAAQLPATINSICKEYLEEVNVSVKQDVHDVAKAGKKLLKAHTSAAGIKGTRYINSFRSKVDNDSYYVTSITLSNKMYQLTHLLENGHYLVYMGRPTGRRTRAFPHWEPAEAEITKLLEEKIEKTIEAKA